MIAEKTERKLEYFANTIQQTIEIKKRDAKNKTEVSINKTATETLEAIARRNKIMLQVKQNELKKIAGRQVAQAKVQAMSRYVQIRKQQIDRLFIEIQAQLAQFTQSAEYETYLLECIKKAQQNGEFLIVKLTPHDMRFEETIKAATGLIPEAENQDLIGGFVILNEARTVQVNYSFKMRLSMAKEAFIYDQGESGTTALSVASEANISHADCFVQSDFHTNEKS